MNYRISQAKRVSLFWNELTSISYFGWALFLHELSLNMFVFNIRLIAVYKTGNNLIFLFGETFRIYFTNRSPNIRFWVGMIMDIIQFTRKYNTTLLNPIRQHFCVLIEIIHREPDESEIRHSRRVGGVLLKMKSLIPHEVLLALASSGHLEIWFLAPAVSLPLYWLERMQDCKTPVLLIAHKGFVIPYISDINH